MGFRIFVWKGKVAKDLWKLLPFLPISNSYQNYPKSNTTVLFKLSVNLYQTFSSRTSVTEEEAVNLWIGKVFADKEDRKKEMERIKVYNW